MADLSHLERMGRELKCPICLSLLDSAVSLVCNHVFCNSCIVKSMKSGSACPVCKVPFHRREVRPAPHMDNLVSIYKNMEVASGVSMHVTQTAHPVKLSGNEKEPHGEFAEGEVMNKRSRIGTRARNANNANNENASPVAVKPSFPTKKRVQVPRHPSKDTRTRAENPNNVLGESNNDMPKDISGESEKIPPLDGNAGYILAPFFWVRDEEGTQRSTQLSDEDLLSGTPPKVPTFSDIKDSDDEMATPLTKDVDGPAKDFFDSEMFEWTQRPCSPELCSSPKKDQDSDNNEKDLEPALKDSVSAEDCNKSKRRRPTRAKALPISLKSVTPQHEADEACKREKAYTGSSSNRKKRQLSTVRTETTHKNTSGNVSDTSNAELTKSKRLLDITTPARQDSLATSKKRKADFTESKNGRGNTSGKKSESSCNPDSNPIKKPPCSVISEAGLVLRKCETISREVSCAFCQSSELSEASGEIVHYCDGKPVSADQIGGSRVIHSHKSCTEWAPNVFFEDEKAINLDAELARSRRIRCCCCGIKGAALGCFEKSCRKSFHVTCAKKIPQCRWDSVNFVMLCPLHPSSKLPIESTHEETKKSSAPKERPQKVLDQVTKRNEATNGFNWNHNALRDRTTLCCSTLTDAEREMVSKFEKLSGVAVMKKWDSKVTHVIASVDENGACRRTLKVLMGILEGKWILTVEWIKACMEAMEPVDEQKYEIKVDVHGMRDGPRLGRLRILDKQPRLFEGMKFYFTGDFLSSYRGYLQDLMTAAGGIILHRKPVLGDMEMPNSSTFIVYNLEILDKPRMNKDKVIKQRKSDAEALAALTRAKVVSNSWILDCVAGCKLQDFCC